MYASTPIVPKNWWILPEGVVGFCYRQEIKKLEATIQEAETERTNQKKEYDVVSNPA